MSTSEVDIIRHAVGVDTYGAFREDRNWFMTGPGGKDYAVCLDLCERGLMVDHGPQKLAAGEHYFTVTMAGRRYMRERLPKPPKRTRAQRRYEAWLRGPSDFISFSEYLKSGLYKEAT